MRSQSVLYVCLAGSQILDLLFHVRFRLLHPVVFGNAIALLPVCCLQLILSEQRGFCPGRFKREAGDFSSDGDGLVAIDNIVGLPCHLYGLQRRTVQTNDRIEVGHDVLAARLRIQGGTGESVRAGLRLLAEKDRSTTRERQQKDYRALP